jgi:hypothetical protein
MAPVVTEPGNAQGPIWVTPNVAVSEGKKSEEGTTMRSPKQFGVSCSSLNQEVITTKWKRSRSAVDDWRRRWPREDIVHLDGGVPTEKVGPWGSKSLAEDHIAVK